MLAFPKMQLIVPLRALVFLTKSVREKIPRRYQTDFASEGSLNTDICAVLPEEGRFGSLEASARRTMKKEHQTTSERSPEGCGRTL
jgi:hypothetical protein